MVEFIIKEQLPSLNDYINKLKSPKGNRVGAGFKSHIDDVCIAYMLPSKQRLKRLCQSPVIIYFEWHEKSKRRDLDNVYSAKKYILDAMQKSGVIDNDNYAHIKGLYDGVVYGKSDYVVVTILTISELSELATLIERDFARAKKEVKI